MTTVPPATAARTTRPTAAVIASTCRSRMPSTTRSAASSAIWVRRLLPVTGAAIAAAVRAAVAPVVAVAGAAIVAAGAADMTATGPDRVSSPHGGSAPGSAAGLEPGVELTTLDNGVRIVTERMADSRSVTLGFWAGIGSRDEPGELAGASHFLEHLLFKGTAQRGARQIAVAVDAVGGEMNAFTTREHTAYYTRLPAGELSFGLDLLTDVVGAPAFRPGEVDAEREVILEEILMNEDAPDDVVHTQLMEAAFPGHPLGRETLGSQDTILAMTRDQIAAFHAGWYRPANLVVAAAGNLHHDQVVASVAAFLADATVGDRPARVGAGGRARAPGGGPSPDRAGARGHGLARSGPPRPGPLRVGRGQPDPGWWDVQPAVPGGARGAWPGLLGVHLARLLRGHRGAHALRRHRAVACRRAARGHRRHHRRPVDRGHHRRRAGGGQGLPRGRHPVGSGGQRQPHGTSGLGTDHRGEIVPSRSTWLAPGR